MLSWWLRPVSTRHGLRISPRWPALSALVSEHDAGSFLPAVSKGSVEIMRTYVDGQWSSPDLYELLCLLYAAQRPFDIPMAVSVPAIRHTAYGTTSSEVYADVSLHYELPPDLFAATIGGGPYSAYRAHLAPSDLAEALQLSNQQLLSSLTADVRNNAPLLDLGAGWGNFAQYALSHTDVPVHAITLSSIQARAMREHLLPLYADRLAIVEGSFLSSGNWPPTASAIVLLESIEHVAPVHRQVLLKQLADRYPNATMAIQFSARPSLRAMARRGRSGSAANVIFPGPGDLPTYGSIVRAARRAGYVVHDARELTADYHQIVLTWLQSFQDNVDSQSIDLHPRLLRLWEFYLTGLAAGLASGSVRNYQAILKR